MVQMIRITILSILFACAGAHAMESPSPEGFRLGLSGSSDSALRYNSGQATSTDLLTEGAFITGPVEVYAGLDGVPGPQMQKPDLGRQLIANIKNGHEDLVAIKIANGVDVNAADGDGITALMHALGYGREDIANMLICAKADVNKADGDGESVLHIASTKNSLEMCKRLINAGANVNCVSKKRLCSEWFGAPWRGYESSPLACAVISSVGGTGRSPICEFLVEEMLSVNRAQKQSMLAFMASLKHKNATIPGVYCKDIRQLVCGSLGVATREYNFSRALAAIKKLPAFREFQLERINNLLKKYFPGETLFD